MDQTKNKTSQRRKRVQLQQNIISLCCLVCIAFVIGWGIHSVGENTRFIQISSTNSTTQKDSSSKKDNSDSKADSSSTDSKKNNESSKAEIIADESSQAEEEEHIYSEAKDTEDDLSDALFVGNSRTVGLENSCDKPKATFYCAVGLNISTAFTDQVITLDNGNMGTIIDALAQGNTFKRVYINFGINEVGWPYIDSFIDYYQQLIDKVKEYNPDAAIYVESILPVTVSREAQGDSINNTNINTFNEAIKQLAADAGVKYLACNEAVMGDDGYLPEDASTDGVHLISEYCKYWLNYIIDNT